MMVNFNSKWNPFGNWDEPDPPEWYKRDQPIWWRRICWFIRNPLHNFTFYWIGMAGCLKYRRPDTVFNPNYKWNIVLPFLSYNGKKIRFYIGWRERGNFGIAIRIKPRK
ncbi:MAG: hypothetical protein ACUVWN_04655 [bacterium]